jgi:hypothetical protein
VYPEIASAAGSSTTEPLSFMLSKLRFEESPVNVKRMTAAWSVGVISARMPSVKVTP